MENHLVIVTIVAVFFGALIHVVSAQTLDAAVPCKDNVNCTDSRLPKDAVCLSGFCVCTEPNSEPKNCSTRHIEAKSAGHNPVTGHTCKFDQDCALPNGVCNTTRSQCECSSGYVMASRSWKCLLIAKTFGQNCEDDQQCRASTMGNNTMCKDEKCICRSGYHYTENACWESAGFGEPCMRNEECSHVENAECNEHLQCACSKNAVLNFDGERCLLVATKLLDSCFEKEQCTKYCPDFDCIDKRCQCRPNNHFEPTLIQCVVSRNLGENCSVDQECFQDEEEDKGQPQRCIGGICTCGEKFRKNGDKCVSSVSGGSSSLISGPIVIVLSALLSFFKS